MNDSVPQVTIGLPVYNGEDFLAEAIESVLEQTFADLELVISDNGSTDLTEEICNRYAAQDARVRYYRSEQNKGASWNYNRTVELARGKYFRWLAHDDKLAPSLVEKSAAVLEMNPEVVLCFTWTQDIDSNGRDIIVKRSTRKFDAKKPSVRFGSMSQIVPIHNCEEVFGLIRTDVLRKTKLIDNYTDSDRTLLAQLSLFGPFYEVNEPLFLHRIHEASSVVVFSDPVSRMAWFDPTQGVRLTFPKWRQLKELSLVILPAPISIGEKLDCFRELARWVTRRRRVLVREARRVLFS
jgi:glycosyltransferase involved in cell wall biosynthesis